MQATTFPTATATTFPLARSRGHRRSPAADLFSSGAGVGAAAAAGLPTFGAGAAAPAAFPFPVRPARRVFHIQDDGDSSSDDDRVQGPSSSSAIPRPPSLAIPFPRTASPAPSPTATRPPLPRSQSAPTVRRPLKPSLKSASSPHVRALSAPATPGGSLRVRFDEELERVCTFTKSSAVASLLSPSAETAPATQFDFPIMPAPAPTKYEIDVAASSPIPSCSASAGDYIRLESLSVSNAPDVAIAGSVLVRNVAFQKDVALRFTMDGWTTTSEVAARYASSTPDGRDRFNFTIPLAGSRDERLMECVARYTSQGVGEWWDNNNSANYKVLVRRVPTPPPSTPVNKAGRFAARAPAPAPVVPAVLPRRPVHIDTAPRRLNEVAAPRKQISIAPRSAWSDSDSDSSSDEEAIRTPEDLEEPAEISAKGVLSGDKSVTDSPLSAPAYRDLISEWCFLTTSTPLVADYIAA
ncbi:putative phosphatase regulatory subunit-domain-containing protein [Schizophyllum commune]